jgi:hypothetical protein
MWATTNQLPIPIHIRIPFLIGVMAKNPSYKLLKEHVIEVEKSMVDNLHWFADKLSTDKFPILDEYVVKAVKEVENLLQPHHKATKMFNPLLNWVDLDPSGLVTFVEILKLKPIKFRHLIQKLDKRKFVIMAKCMGSVVAAGVKHPCVDHKELLVK